jgi:hypothetical protein
LLNIVSSAPSLRRRRSSGTTIEGKTAVSFNGCAMVSPRSMLLRVVWIASSTIALPAVFAVMSSASRMETPDASSVESVRQNLAHRDFAHQRAENRQLQHDGVDRPAAIRGGVSNCFNP